MRVGVAGVVGVLLLVACTPAGTAPVTKPSAAAPAPAAADRVTLERLYGSYRTADGGTLVVTRMGWFADLRDSTYRTLYAGDRPDRLTLGPSFRVPVPTAVRLDFSSGDVSMTRGGQTTAATRMSLKHTDVGIPAGGAKLAATITEPLGSGPRPGIVIVHGSERGQRYFYDFWVGLYTSLGLTVLTYDKRGNGESTGTYPGEYPTDQSLAIYADDASAALDFLAGWPGVDPGRVGFHGGSQGGWTVPLAMARHSRGTFAILVSAPAVTVAQQGVWSAYSSGGTLQPKESLEEMNAAVRRDRSGYDPAPALAALAVPSLWVLGRNDRVVPTAVCVETLMALGNPKVTIAVVTSGHGLLQNQTGLNADDDRAVGLAPEVIPAITGWVKRTL